MQDGETIWPSVGISSRFTAWETTLAEFHHGETTSSLFSLFYAKSVVLLTTTRNSALHDDFW